MQVYIPYMDPMGFGSFFWAREFFCRKWKDPFDVSVFHNIYCKQFGVALDKFVHCFLGFHI